MSIKRNNPKIYKKLCNASLAAAARVKGTMIQHSWRKMQTSGKGGKHGWCLGTGCTTTDKAVLSRVIAGLQGEGGGGGGGCRGTLSVRSRGCKTNTATQQPKITYIRSIEPSFSSTLLSLGGNRDNGGQRIIVLLLRRRETTAYVSNSFVVILSSRFEGQNST